MKYLLILFALVLFVSIVNHAKAYDQPAAMAIAQAHYGVPCGGAVTVSWAHLGTGVNARSSWTQPTFTDCSITYSYDVGWDPQKFCTVTEHEVGHLTGHVHGEGLIMSAYYIGPSPECIAAYPERIAWRPGPSVTKHTHRPRNPRYAVHMKRFTITATAGNRGNKRFAVLDRHSGGPGMKRVSWHTTFREAKAAARKLNRQEDNT